MEAFTFLWLAFNVNGCSSREALRSSGGEMYRNPLNGSEGLQFGSVIIGGKICAFERWQSGMKESLLIVSFAFPSEFVACDFLFCFNF